MAVHFETVWWETGLVMVTAGPVTSMRFDQVSLHVKTAILFLLLIIFPNASGCLLWSGRFHRGVRHLLPMEQIAKRMRDREVSRFISIQKSTKESFGYQWLRYDVESDEEDREIFLCDSQLSEKELQNKIILDAGCGMGRYTRVAGAMGGEILGVDLSQSILKAYQKTKDNPCAHIMQADLLHLPFREKQFDIIYSLGVLHHTPDPRQAFFNLAHCLKERGIMAIWVYGTAGKI